MSEDVTDGMVFDLRDVDMTKLLAEAVGADMKTALDRLLASNTSGNNSFSNCIG